MCNFGGGPSAPPPPPPPDPSIEEEAKARRKRERMKLQSETSALKEQQYEQRVAASYGKRGRRSLLSGSRGGKGFALEPKLMSKTILGT